jgi:hypothetical protein
VACSETLYQYNQHLHPHSQHLKKWTLRRIDGVFGIYETLFLVIKG